MKIGIGIDTAGNVSGSGCGPFPEPYSQTKSILFDGVNDALEVSGSPSFSGANKDYAVAVWFKTSTVAASDHYVVKHGTDFVLYLNSAQKLTFTHRTTGGYVSATSTQTYNNGIWHFAVISFDYSGAFIALDINGGSERITTAAVDRLGNSATFVMGRHSAGLGAWPGNLDEVAFFSQPPSAAECVELYNTGQALDLANYSKCETVVSWWRMGDLPGDSTDSSDPSARVNDALGINDASPIQMAPGAIVLDVPPSPAGPFDTKSVEFDGISEMLDRSHATTTGIYPEWNQPWTVNAWIRSSERTGATMFFGRQLTAGTMRGFSVGLYLGQPFVFISHDHGANAYIQESQTQTVAYGRWTMLTYKFSGSGVASGITMYINGVPQGSFPTPSTLTWWDALGGGTIQGGAPLTIGRGSNAAYFNGQVADCSFWDVELSDAQVLTLYNSAGAGQFGRPLDITGFANLESWWRMGDAAGDSTAPGGFIFDEGPNGNDLSPVNMVAGNVLTDSPGALTLVNNVSCGFDGIDERINVGNDASFSGTGDFTAAAWFKTSAGGTADIFGKWQGLGTRDWVIFLNAGKIQAYMQDGGALTPFASTVGTFNDGAWHLAVMTWDSTAQQLTIDVDGGADRVSTAVTSRLGSAGSDVVIAARDNGGGTYVSHFNGRVDEPAFWSSALSAADIVDLYNGGTPVSPVTHAASATLEHWWRMGDNTFDSIATTQAAVFDVVGSSDGFQDNMEDADMAEDVP